MCDLLPIKRSKSQAQRFYDRISGIYDLLTSSEKPLIKQGLQLLAVQPGEHVLEIGCGTGSALNWIHENAPSPAGVIGLDLSYQMLLKSQQKTSAVHPTPLHIQGDGVKLPIPNAVFDAVFMSFTLELFSEADISTLLGECRRVLKSRGRLVIVSLADTPRTLPLRLYELAHRLFPVAVDCRPIPLLDLLGSHGFEVKTAIKERNWGLPVHLTRSETNHDQDRKRDQLTHNA